MSTYVSLFSVSLTFPHLAHVVARHTVCLRPDNAEAWERCGCGLLALWKPATHDAAVPPVRWTGSHACLGGGRCRWRGVSGGWRPRGHKLVRGCLRRDGRDGDRERRQLRVIGAEEQQLDRNGVEEQLSTEAREGTAGGANSDSPGFTSPLFSDSGTATLLSCAWPSVLSSVFSTAGGSSFLSSSPSVFSAACALGASFFSSSAFSARQF